MAGLISLWCLAVAELVAVVFTNVPLGAEARALFVFGDSLVDNGNNDYLVTTARADSPPYGIDFPTHRPTGRFSNGLNIPDLISEYMGMESPLPYLNPLLKGEKLLAGANFASAGIGILNDTGVQFLNIIRIWKQIAYFEQYQNRLSAVVGADRTHEVVSNGLSLISLGGNDFVNNYYLIPYSARSRQYSLPDYVRYLVSEYRKILLGTWALREYGGLQKSPLRGAWWLRMYDVGVERILVMGTGPMGCVPAELAQRSRTGECSAELQQAANLFNPQLYTMLNQLNEEKGSHVFVAANLMRMHMDYISNPQAYGFVTSKVACCGQGPYNGLGLCTPMSNLCPNRDIFAFWDPFHPSERANKIIVQQIMSGTSNYMNPMNLSTILAMASDP